jgi:hypothetical protein
MAATTVDDESLSSECTVGEELGYEHLHDRCTRTQDIPLPYSTGILLVKRCRCLCHG